MPPVITQIRPASAKVTPVTRTRASAARPVQTTHVLGPVQRRPLPKQVLKQPNHKLPLARLLAPQVSAYKPAPKTLAQLAGPQQFTTKHFAQPTQPRVITPKLQSALDTAARIADAVALAVSPKTPIKALPTTAQRTPPAVQTVAQPAAKQNPSIQVSLVSTAVTVLTASSPTVLATPVVQTPATTAIQAQPATVQVKTATELSAAVTALAIQVSLMSAEHDLATAQAQNTQSQLAITQAKLATKPIAAELILLGTIIKRLPEQVPMNRLVAILNRIPELAETFELKAVLKTLGVSGEVIAKQKVVQALTQALLSPTADVRLQNKINTLVRIALAPPAQSTEVPAALLKGSLFVDVRGKFTKESSEIDIGVDSTSEAYGLSPLRVQASGNSTNNPNHGGSQQQDDPDSFEFELV